MKLDMAFFNRAKCRGAALREPCRRTGWGGMQAADAAGVGVLPGTCDARTDAGACSLTKAVLRYTAPCSTQEACLRKRAGLAYACTALHHLAMISLLAVQPNEFTGSAPLPDLPEPLRLALEGANATVLGRATCHTLVQQVSALAPQQAWVHLPEPAHQLPALVEALQAWGGAPPCALSLA
ncbi:MAG TPA: hypothetical protein VN280_12890, partial [Variovorax sp.]|nr:hypothetical protein [Variovorax sp.]